MRKRLSRVAPLQLGIVLAALYGLLSLIFVPFIVLITILTAMHHTNGPKPIGIVGGVVMLILLPILYTVLGFIFGVLGGAVYNFVATLTGGIEFTVTDLAM
jgi:hypothetical protein